MKRPKTWPGSHAAKKSASKKQAPAKAGEQSTTDAPPSPPETTDKPAS